MCFKSSAKKTGCNKWKAVEKGSIEREKKRQHTGEIKGSDWERKKT
jgi:hypothetical protein